MDRRKKVLKQIPHKLSEENERERFQDVIASPDGVPQ